MADSINGIGESKGTRRGRITDSLPTRFTTLSEEEKIYTDWDL